MEIKKISTQKSKKWANPFRPQLFDDFIWQPEIKKVLKAAIKSAEKRATNLWHILFSWESGYWKTTLAQIIAKELWVNIQIITWYAISKPAEIISVLNSLEEWDILFIDEIHRLRPNVEEVLYIAMEDYNIDMVMPEWWNVKIPLNNFTLIWATTKLESLASPLKNRFVYKFHFEDYDNDEKQEIIRRYLNLYSINFDTETVKKICENVVSVPREINNFCVKIRDYLISKWAKIDNLNMDNEIWNEFRKWAKVVNWWLSNVHQKYISILQESNWPVWVKTIALKLGLNEQAVEDDIEPLLLKLWLIEKSSRWRTLKQ